MKTFADLTTEEKREIRKKAKEFYDAHKAHVVSIYLAYPTVGIAPSGSDMFRPELWKGMHWRWFRNEWSDFEMPKLKYRLTIMQKIKRWLREIIR